MKQTGLPISLLQETSKVSIFILILASTPPHSGA